MLQKKYKFFDFSYSILFHKGSFHAACLIKYKKDEQKRILLLVFFFLFDPQNAEPCKLTPSERQVGYRKHTSAFHCLSFRPEA